VGGLQPTLIMISTVNTAVKK